MVLYTNMDELSEHLTHVRCSSYTFPLSLYTGSESSWYGQLSCFFFFFFYHGYILVVIVLLAMARGLLRRKRKKKNSTSNTATVDQYCTKFTFTSRRALQKLLVNHKEAQESASQAFTVSFPHFPQHFCVPFSTFFSASDTEAGQIPLAMSLSLNISLQATSSGTDPNTN